MKVRRDVAQAGIGQNGVKSVIILFARPCDGYARMYSLRLVPFAFRQETVAFMKTGTRIPKWQLTGQLVERGGLERLFSLLFS